jgi:rRNA-processing protein FCF1
VTRIGLVSPRPNLVIDTNILLLLLGYQCSQFENLGAPARRRILEEIRGRGAVSPEWFDELWLFFQNAAQSAVTQHVIAETYGLRNRLGAFRSRKDLVWRAALEILRSPGIVEVSFQLEELDDLPEYRKILIEIGPTDTGLLYIAQQRKAVLLTEDGPLQHWASVRSIPWLTLNQLGLTS